MREMQHARSRGISRWVAPLCGLFAALSSGVGARAEPPRGAEREAQGVQILRALAYKAGDSSDAHTLDLYLPARAAEKPPLLVYIHGGAWISGDRRQYLPLAAGILTGGAAVAVINYRLSDAGRDPHPAHVQDAAAAVAFLRKNAGQNGYDPERIFVCGHSAGAHISALLAFQPSYLSAVGEKPDSIRGFIGIEGIYDLPALVGRWPAYREDFVTTAFGTDEKAWAAASPQRLTLSGQRPWLLIHSTQDELVDEPQSRRFAEALRAAGVPVQYAVVQKGSHFGVLGQLGDPTSALGAQLLRFLRPAATPPAQSARPAR